MFIWRKVVETRGQFWRVQSCSKSRRIRFHIYDVRFRIMGVESSVIETIGVSELLKFAQVFFLKKVPPESLELRFRV